MRVIILARGQGTRLWPLSTPQVPKQFVELIGGESLLQLSVQRAQALTQLDEIFIVTGAPYVPLVRAALSPIEGSEAITIVIEPEGKNTAPAIALALNAARKKGMGGPGDCFLVLSSDHLMRPRHRFAQVCAEAEGKARQGYMVAFGAPALRPETGYGYLKREGERCHFIEKPSPERAEEFVKSGEYLWNCGMFAFTLSQFALECEKHLPALYELIFAEDERAAFAAAPNISIDYGIMERTERVAAAPLEGIEWSDVGAFDALHRALGSDDKGNVLIGDVDLEECRDSFAYSSERPVAAVGLDHIAIIDAPHALLVADMRNSQAVKAVAARAEPARRPHVEMLALEPEEERIIGPRPGSCYLIVDSGLAEIDGEKVEAGCSVVIPAGRRSAISNQGSTLLEVVFVEIAQRPTSKKQRESVSWN